MALVRPVSACRAAPGKTELDEDDVYGLAAVLWFCLTGEAAAECHGFGAARSRAGRSRAPLNEALAWESGPIPTAVEFKASLVEALGEIGP